MTLTIYGSPRSRTMRVLWTAEELGLDYVHVPLGWDDPALKQPAFLRINPAGAIPAMDDDGFVLAESLAINLYLAKTYGRGAPTPLYPADPRAEAQVWRWSLWAQGQLEPWVQQDALLAAFRAAAADHTRAAIARSLETLERVFADADWLVGGLFTVGDLNVAAVLSPSRARTLDLEPYPRLRSWLARCYGRPAAVETRRRFAG